MPGEFHGQKSLRNTVSRVAESDETEVTEHSIEISDASWQVPFSKGNIKAAGPGTAALVSYFSLLMLSILFASEAAASLGGTLQGGFTWGDVEKSLPPALIAGRWGGPLAQFRSDIKVLLCIITLMCMTVTKNIQFLRAL